MFASEILSVSHYFMDLLLSQAASLPSQTWQDQPEWPIAVAQAIRFRARWCPSLVSGCEELLGRSANPLPRRCYAGTWSHYLKNLLRLPPLTVASSLLEILPSEQLAKQGRAYPKNVQAFHGVKPSIPLASGLNRWAKGDLPKHYWSCGKGRVWFLDLQLLSDLFRGLLAMTVTLNSQTHLCVKQTLAGNDTKHDRGHRVQWIWYIARSKKSLHHLDYFGTQPQYAATRAYIQRSTTVLSSTSLLNSCRFSGRVLYFTTDQSHPRM